MAYQVTPNGPVVHITTTPTGQTVTSYNPHTGKTTTLQNTTTSSIPNVLNGSLMNPNAPGLHLTLVGWFVFLLLLYAWSKTNMGHEVIYYGLVLILILLLVRNYQYVLKDFTYRVN
ncbi:hypothetical protein LLE49_20010 [Alicyclobacillus tolerans]|uniref:hypothetical protein n=1 Tax=Alicyclobacillus tolerans TaxID=90970 RepID=UPI001F1752C0|nr:hypothetical protein [Alicyclobacillus tolerans]MCF8567009.1 hypothetical protein [Alicyclobacillus tolerans]